MGLFFLNIPKNHIMNSYNFLCMKKALLILTAALIIFSLGCTKISKDSPVPETETEEQSFKLAVVGDTGMNDDTKKVLQLVKESNAQALLLLGDLNYKVIKEDPEEGEVLYSSSDKASDYFEMLDSVFAEDFPIIPVIGDHDVDVWLEEYGPKFEARLKKQDDYFESETEGVGVRSYFPYNGIDIIQIATGFNKFGTQESNTDYIWQNTSNRICLTMWHNNRWAFNAEDVADRASLEVFEEARRQGCLILNGHHHSYSRTFVFKDMIEPENNAVDKTNPYTIKDGQTMAIVAGTGGRGLFEIDQPNIDMQDYWPFTYNENFGALFLNFTKTGDRLDNKVSAEFININNEIIDEFEIVFED